MSDLEQVIGESIDDAGISETPESTEAATEAPQSTEGSDPAETEAPEATPTETPDPVAPTETKVDDFDKKHGITAQAIGGRENRIPYSRVKKITQNAVSEVAEAALGRKPTPEEASKIAEVVKSHVARLPELETKVKTYENQLTSYQGFENIMVNDAEKHLRMLSTLPAYKKFFAAVEQAFERLEQVPAQPEATPVGSDMPQPNYKYPDGSLGYDMDGIKALMEWQAKQVEARITKQVESRYEPIERNWQIQQRIEAVRPTVERQIAEARQWEKFTDNEDEIVKVLQAYPQLSLEAAYHRVVDPKIKAAWEEERAKLLTDRTKMREELMAEIKQAPRSTSAPALPSRAPAQSTSGPRRLEDIIAEQIKGLKT